MSLFTTSPIVLNDGTNDHSFEFKAQIPDGKSIVGQFIELAAVSAAESNLLFKHLENNVRRRLISVRKNFEDTSAESAYVPITINLTATYGKTADPADVAAQLNILKDMLGQPGFVNSFLKGQIS